MSDWDYGRENGLWGDDGIPYGIDDYETSYSRESKEIDNSFAILIYEVEIYVGLMKECNINSIVDMNIYITKENLWEKFPNIRRKNTFASGFVYMGISKEAYREITFSLKTNDVVISHLLSQTKVKKVEKKQGIFVYE